MLNVNKVIYEESVRLLQNQSASLDDLRGRAGTLLAAASLVTAFLAPPALKVNDAAGKAQYNFTCLAWLATGAFVGVTVTSLIVLLPRKWTFGHDAHDLMDKFVESTPPGDEEALYYHLAYYNELHHRQNSSKLGCLFGCFGVGCGLLAIEIGCWLALIAT